MEFGFSEEQDILRKSVREFMVNEAPLTHTRAMEEDPKGYSPELWRKIAGLDWIGLDYPEQYGGLGGSFIDVAVVAEEMGRVLFPSPYIATAVLAGHILLAAGNNNRKSDLLPKIAKGETILTLALTEPSATYEASGVETRATPTTDGSYVLSGIKLLVPFAHVADLMIVAAHTGSSSGKDGPSEDNISLFLVDPKAPGVRISPLRITSGEKQSEVILHDVKVPAAGLVGLPGGGWPVIREALDRGKVAMAAEMVGGAQAALDRAVNYARERTQFGGPIGRFQAIKHRLADLATELEGARWLTYEAATAIAEGEPNPAVASMAKAFISTAYLRAARTAVQIHGGYGFMLECDVQLFFRRAKAAEAILGDQRHNQELVAQQLGL